MKDDEIRINRLYEYMDGLASHHYWLGLDQVQKLDDMRPYNVGISTKDPEEGTEDDYLVVLFPIPIHNPDGWTQLYISEAQEEDHYHKMIRYDDIYDEALSNPKEVACMPYAWDNISTAVKLRKRLLEEKKVLKQNCQLLLGVVCSCLIMPVNEASPGYDPDMWQSSAYLKASEGWNAVVMRLIKNDLHPKQFLQTIFYPRHDIMMNDIIPVIDENDEYFKGKVIEHFNWMDTLQLNL